MLHLIQFKKTSPLFGILIHMHFAIDLSIFQFEFPYQLFIKAKVQAMCVYLLN